MARYLIEIPHNNDYDSCVSAVSLLISTGSHFLTNADWGCSDGEHKAWIVVEAENRDQAKSVLPPVSRPTAKVIQLNKFTMEVFDKILYYHKDSA